MSKATPISVVACLLCLFACFGSFAVEGSPMLVIAHRGGVVDETRTENSLGALEEAIRRGYTHVEVDLRSTKDGHPVCLHDRSLRRTLDMKINIDEITLEELRALASEDRIPSFETYCEKMAGRILLMPDVKAVPPDLIDPFVARVEAILSSHDLMSSALFIGQNDIIQAFRGKGKLKWRDRLEEARTSDRAKDDPGRFYFVFNHGADFDREQVDGFHEMGLEVIVSINTFHYVRGDPIADGLKHIREMIALGVDGLQIDSVYDETVFKLLREAKTK